MIDLLPDHPNIGQMTSRAGMGRLAASPYTHLNFYPITETTSRQSGFEPSNNQYKTAVSSLGPAGGA
jgi:hypothetical protein